MLNEGFVSIKVDREERPDLDSIYMTAVQMMTGHGGWPMSVFLTPDQKPFFGGTYWPPEPRRGMPGFKQVLVGVADAWKNRRTEAIEQSGKLTEAIAQLTTPSGSGDLTEEMLHGALATLERSFDASHGGFGDAPKFPHGMQVQLLFRLWRREPKDAIVAMATLTLDRMHAGGMYDHLAGGFARYSVDERWLVPHFEKMLYDNALLSLAYLDGYLATGNEAYARVVRETLDFWLSDMTDPTGGFYSTLDADSEGVEGKFYVWTPAEIREVLGDDAAETFCYVYDVTDVGNFEGKSILNLPKTIEQCAQIRGRDAKELETELAESRATLLAVRSKRIPPGCDDKVLVSWNALLIDALSRAGAVLGEPRYVDAATKAAEFIHANMRREDGRLLHTWRQGQAKLDAYLDDYACLINALVSLYEATFDERWVEEAVRLADIVLEQFGDDREGAFYFTAADHEALITRQKDMHDSSTPSGNGMAAFALARLGRLTGDNRFSDAAESTLKAAAEVMSRQTMAAGQLLLALDDYLHPQPEVALLGSGADFDNVLADLRGRYLPGLVVAARPTAETGTNVSSTLTPIFTGKTLDGAGPTAYICRDFACEAPVSGKDAILEAWAEM
ncbi:MAG: thioredoxin domain-containing protein, partial [Pirellulales bacterium]|nr:thioredoxin domain-containing protein [Pirellulales bacterium]